MILLKMEILTILENCYTKAGYLKNNCPQILQIKKLITCMIMQLKNGALGGKLLGAGGGGFLLMYMKKNIDKIFLEIIRISLMSRLNFQTRALKLYSKILRLQNEIKPQTHE